MTGNSMTERLKNNKNLSINIPNKITLKPRIAPGPLKHVGKSFDATAPSRVFTNTIDNQINWGRLPAGG